MKKVNIKKGLRLLLDIIICLCILFQSIKKGGFYSSDIYFFVIIVIILGSIIGFIKLITILIKKEKLYTYISKIESIVILFALLAVSYFLPILFGKAIHIRDSQFEFLRYASIFIIFLIVRNSENKGIYYFTLIAIGILQSVVGIDGLGSRILEPYLKQISSRVSN